MHRTATAVEFDFRGWFSAGVSSLTDDDAPSPWTQWAPGVVAAMAD